MSPETTTDRTSNESSLATSLPSSSTANGGFVGPQAPFLSNVSEGESKAGPRSPYSATRSLLQTLTAPATPRINIPPSPPGTVHDELNKKFQHFIDLKKQDVHFNEKLARSSALKNPGLLKKLMEFAGIEAEASYDTTLPRNIWDPLSYASHKEA